MAAKAQTIEIKPINIETVSITIVGKTPLIVHAWPEKAKREILDKQRGKAKSGAKHAIKIPVNDFMGSLHWLTDSPEPGKNDDEAEANWLAAIEGGARFGFPVNGIKASIANGSYRAGITKDKASVLAAFHLEGGTKYSTIEMAEIISDAPTMREDMVRIQGKADIRHRAEFKEWEIPVLVKYNSKGKYSLEQILNFINYGGFSSGIGEWRPEKGGHFGMYELKV